VTNFAVPIEKEFIYLELRILLETLRTLVLDLRLREGFQAGGNYVPQGSFLALDDGSGGHDRESGFVGEGGSERIDQFWTLLFRQTKAAERPAPSLSLSSRLAFCSGRMMKEPTSPTAPLATFPPQPEEYRSRAPEFYGFVAWSSTYLLFILFILWSFLPDEWIIWSGVTWYPNRYFRSTLLFRVSI
jgi:hypothetical protein